MKLRPILMSGPMVVAIQDGRKTQTRRIAKAPKGSPCILGPGDAPEWKRLMDSCPYGEVGDVLWVREAFLYAEDYACSDYDPDDPDSEPQFSYRADCPADQQRVYSWKPSIYMPYAACRLWLRITNVRVERLLDITDTGCILEGIETIPVRNLDDPNDTVRYKCYQMRLYGKDWFRLPRQSFKSLWCRINGNGSWNRNPWVWVVEFERCEKPKTQAC